MVGDGRFDFAVKVDFKSKRGRIKNRAAIVAVADMSLNFPANLG